MSDKTYTNPAEFFKDHVATEIALFRGTSTLQPNKARKYLREAARRRRDDRKND